MKRRAFIALCSAAWLPACGLRLRGTTSTPALKSAVALAHDSAPLLADYLLTHPLGVRFLNAGADGAGPIQLRLSAENLQRSAVSFSPRTGHAVEYRLDYSVKAQAGYGDGRTVLQAQRIRAYEDYLLGDSNIGDSARVETLKQELLRRAAEDLQRRLAAALRLAP